VQSQFPLLFFLVFISSMNLPRNLIEVSWFRDLATINPVSYLIEGLRTLIIEGWNAQALALGFGVATPHGPGRARRRLDRAAPTHGADVNGRGLSVTLGLAHRQMTLLIKNPSLLFPPMLFPLMNFLAFAGGLSRLRHVPGFNYPGGYTAFQFVFVLLRSAAFGGVFMGFGIARDFETRIRPPPARGRAESQRADRGLCARGPLPVEHGRRDAHDRRDRRRDADRRERDRHLRPLRPGRDRETSWGSSGLPGLRCASALFRQRR